MQDIKKSLYSRPEARLISPLQAVAFLFPTYKPETFFVFLAFPKKPRNYFLPVHLARRPGDSLYSELHNAVRLVKGYRRALTGYFFRAESFFNLATKADEYDRENPWGPSFGDRSLHAQSHGESFLSFFQTFKSAGLYLMDEPEAALSPQRQLTLLLYMKRLAEQGSQIVVASHSPILLGIPDAQIYSFDGGVIHEISWEETESYRLTKLFLDHRESVLKQLLK